MSRCLHVGDSNHQTWRLRGHGPQSQVHQRSLQIPPQPERHVVATTSDPGAFDLKGIRSWLSPMHPSIRTHCLTWWARMATNSFKNQATGSQIQRNLVIQNPPGMGTIDTIVLLSSCNLGAKSAITSSQVKPLSHTLPHHPSCHTWRIFLHLQSRLLSIPYVDGMGMVML